MREILEALRYAAAFFCFGAGLVFGISGLLGLYRYKDPLAKLQGSALCGTTAVFSILLGCLALSPTWAFFFRLMVILVFFLISNPLGTHFIAGYVWKNLSGKGRKEE